MQQQQVQLVNHIIQDQHQVVNHQIIGANQRVITQHVITDQVGHMMPQVLLLLWHFILFLICGNSFFSSGCY